MFLFPADGVFEIVLAYGQMISLFLVFVAVEGLLAAKSESPVPGLVFIGLVVLLAIGVGIGFGDMTFCGFMLIPAVLCLIAFFISRKTRARNIAKGVRYNAEGLIEEELEKMEKGQ